MVNSSSDPNRSSMMIQAVSKLTSLHESGQLTNAEYIMEVGTLFSVPVEPVVVADFGMEASNE